MQRNDGVTVWSPGWFSSVEPGCGVLNSLVALCFMGFCILLPGSGTFASNGVSLGGLTGLRGHAQSRCIMVRLSKKPAVNLRCGIILPTS